MGSGIKFNLMRIMGPHPFVMENVQPIGMKLSVQPVKWKVKDAEGHVGLVQKPVVVKDDF